MNNRFFIISSMIMTVAYILFGLFIAFFADFQNTFGPAVRIGFAIVVIAYGIFRGYRAFKILNVRRNEQQQ